MSRGTLPVVPQQAKCRVVFGQSRAETLAAAGAPEALHVALPVLAGPPDELLLDGAESPRRAGRFTLFEGAGTLAGIAVAPPELELEAAASYLYDNLFAVSRGLHLYRIWNYVPRINATEHELENYRLFCRGRSLAFERQFGSAFNKILPAASAVGAVTGPLALGFLASDAQPRHFENPRQVPAFEYPPQYGPRPPSFARATAITTERGRQIFISGTAAISGHATVADGDLERQLDCTLQNLGLIAAAAGTENAFGPGSGWSRRFKIYIRRASDLGRISARLEKTLLRGGGTAQYLQADLCRAGLLVEIEAVLAATD